MPDIPDLLRELQRDRPQSVAEMEFLERVRFDVEKIADELLARWPDRPYSTSMANGFLKEIGEHIPDPWIRGAVKAVAVSVFERRGAL